MLEEVRHFHHRWAQQCNQTASAVQTLEVTRNVDLCCSTICTDHISTHVAFKVVLAKREHDFFSKLEATFLHQVCVTARIPQQTNLRLTQLLEDSGESRVMLFLHHSQNPHVGCKARTRFCEARLAQLRTRLFKRRNPRQVHALPTFQAKRYSVA